MSTDRPTIPLSRIPDVGPVILGLLALAITITAIGMTVAPGPWTATTSDFLSIACDAAPVVAAVLVALWKDASPRLARAWLLIGVGFAFNLFGDVAWVVLSAGGNETPCPSIADPL